MESCSTTINTATFFDSIYSHLVRCCARRRLPTSYYSLLLHSAFLPYYENSGCSFLCLAFSLHSKRLHFFPKMNEKIQEFLETWSQNGQRSSKEKKLYQRGVPHSFFFLACTQNNAIKMKVLIMRVMALQKETGKKNSCYILTDERLQRVCCWQQLLANDTCARKGPQRSGILQSTDDKNMDADIGVEPSQSSCPERIDTICDAWLLDTHPNHHLCLPLLVLLVINTQKQNTNQKNNFLCTTKNYRFS